MGHKSVIIMQLKIVVLDLDHLEHKGLTVNIIALMIKLMIFIIIQRLLNLVLEEQLMMYLKKSEITTYLLMRVKN